MVGAAFAGLSRLVGVCGVFHLGGFSGNELPLGTVPLAVLLAGTFWVVTARGVWTETRRVAGLAAVFAGAVDPLDARRFSAHVLLLSRGLLQVFLGRSALVHRR